jgi:hypothetical protein
VTEGNIVFSSVAGVEDYLHPVLHVILMMSDERHEEGLDNN